MKTRRFSLLILLALLWAGCAGQERPGPAAPATPAPTLAADRPALKPVLTATTVAAVVRETAPQPTPTTTLLPATATPEPAATPTPWPFEPPTGQIFFFYAPDPLDYEPHGEMNEFNLYRAEATGDPRDWRITTVFTQTAPQGQVMLSPDQTRLAFLLVYDTNDDGRLTAGATPDLRDVFIYHLPQESIQQLTTAQVSENTINSIAWTPESDAILACYTYEIARIPTDNSLPEIILNASDFAFKGTFTLSPDKNLLIFPTTGSAIGEGAYQGNDRLQAFTLDTDTRTTLREGVNLTLASSEWSPDGNWWAYRDWSGHSFVLNTSTPSELLPLLLESDVSDVYGWSRDGRWLSIVKNWNSLLLWSPETLTTTELLTGSEIKLPVWSPQANQIAVSVARDTADELLLVDAETGDLQTLLPAIPERHIKPYSWSPDGNWLLLLIEEPEHAGLFILYPDSGALFKIIDTTNGLLDFAHTWTPDL